MNKENLKDWIILLMIAHILVFIYSSCKSSYLYPSPPDDAFLDSPEYKNNPYKVWADSEYWLIDTTWINPNLNKNKSK